MGQVGDGGDVDDLQRRVGNGLEESDPCVRADGRSPGVNIGAVDQRHLHPEAPQHIVEDIQARSEQGAGRDDMVARLQNSHHRTVYGGHAGGAGESIFRSFQSGDPVLEHGDGRVSIARVDELLTPGVQKTRFGIFGCVVDKPLGQEDRFGDLSILAATGAGVDGIGAGFALARV